MKYFILFGPPGAGKGTHAAPLSKKYNLKHLSTGELLRAEIAEGTELGLHAKSLIDKGNLVPDEVVEGMIAKAFGKYRDVAGFLLDGFPRTVTQAYDLKEMLEARDEKVNGVLSLMIPDDLVFERIAGRAKVEGRADDANPEIIRNRIKTYHEKTEPLIALYKDEGIYYEIDGTGTIDEVHERVSATVQGILDKA